MTKKLLRCGNTLALVIEDSILNALSIDEATPLAVSTENRKIVIQKREFGIVSDDPKIQTAFEEVLKKLALT